jgi:hypothetical protein
MNFYQETPEDRFRKKEALEKQIQDAVHKNQSSFKEWWLKPVTLAVSKWAILGVLAFIASLCWPYITNMLSKLQ